MSRINPFLRLHHRFTHLVPAGETLLLVGDDDSFLLDVPISGDVVQLLDGSRTAVGIAETLEDRHPPEVVHFLLLKLEKEGLVLPLDERGQDLPGIIPSGKGEVGPASLAIAIREAWEGGQANGVVRVSLDPHTQDSWDLVLTDDYLRAEILDCQADLRESGRPFLLASLGSRRVWIGPRIIFGTTACVACLQERLRINLAARALLHLPPEETGDETLQIQPLPRSIPWGAYIKVADRIQGGDQAGRSTLQVVPLENGLGEVHRVARLPHCSVCGDPTLAPAGADFQLRNTPRLRLSTGGYRSVEPAETLRRLTPLISPLTGVIRHVRKVPVEQAESVHVYTANYAHCYNARGIKTPQADRRDRSGGKGMTDAEARVSAICESVERFSNVYRGNEPTQVARLSELGAEAFHPNDLLLFSSAQFEDRDAWNKQDHSGFQFVPEPYKDEPVEWSLVRSLATDQVKMIPSAVVYSGFRGMGTRFCKADSNGLASGNCLEEAVLQGFLELVERDAVALWWYNRVPRPGVDLESFDHELVRQTVDLYPTLQRSLWVLDLTTDLQIPSFAALSALQDESREDIIFGFGAHLDPEIALLRALSELNQMLPTIIRSPEERRMQLLPDFEDALRWWDQARREEHAYLEPAPGLATRTLSDYPLPASRGLLEDVKHCVARARAASCDVLVHDLTRPDVGFPVARVMVPGLRHFWRRLGPGRLYDIPVELRWIEESRPEAAMNPVSMFV